MTSKQALLGRSLAAVMMATTMPGVAHADDMADMQAQLRELAATMKAMQQHQTELEKRLADSEAARTALAARSAPATAPALAAVSTERATGQLSTAGATATGNQPGRADQLAAGGNDRPSGTIAPNPLFSNQPVATGKGASFIVPGTNTTLRFAGLVKFDAFDDLSGANLNVIPTDGVAIPIRGTSQSRRNGHFMMSARQTRFGFASETPTKFGPLKSLIELDFYGTGGQAAYTNPVSPRLRHAYVSLGGLTVGQTWSNFFDLEAAPETLDMTGPVGNAYAIRQPLIQYRHTLGSHGTVTVAAENPEGDFLGADHTANIPVGAVMSTRVLNQAPDFTARYTWKGDRLRVSVAGLARFINLDTGGASLSFLGPNGNFTYAGSASTWGFAGQADATIKTWGQDSFTLQGNAGPGLGRYIMVPQDNAGVIGVAPNGAANANPGSGAVLGPDGKLRTIFTYGGSAWYRHYWSKTWRSNLVAGFEKLSDANDTLPINYPDTLTTVHANLIWSPLPQLGVGMEYVHGFLGLRGQTDANRTLGYGDDGVLNRIQFSVQYNLF